MQEELNKIILEFRKWIDYNLIKIQQEESQFRDSVDRQDKSKNKLNKLSNQLKTRKIIIKANQDAIDIQMAMIKFIAQYQEIIEQYDDSQERAEDIINLGICLPENKDNKEGNVTEPVDYYRLTIDGVMKYNKNHPMFGNREFFKKIFDYFIEKEEYERCEELKGYRLN
jgi:hypothetical protein